MTIDEFKTQIKDIAELAASVPKPFQDKCFEILLSHLVRQADAEASAGSAELPRPPQDARSAPAEQAGAKPPTLGSSIPMNAALRVFMKKTGITQEELDRVVMVEEGQAYFLREPKAKTVSRGQLEWSLLIALKSGILKQTFSADPEEVRSICQEKGFYDKNNFAAHFKKPAFATLFKAPLEPQGEPQLLSNPGLEALGQLVKSLASESA